MNVAPARDQRSGQGLHAAEEDHDQGIEGARNFQLGPGKIAALGEDEQSPPASPAMAPANDQRGPTACRFTSIPVLRLRTRRCESRQARTA